MEFKVTRSDGELYHYGILGQKWGVRRYQNLDGTLTKAGLERYRESKERYERYKQKYETIRNDKSASRVDKKIAKEKVRKAKQDMDKRYSNLSIYEKADKGKVRYQTGERITSKAAVSSAITLIGGLSIGVAKSIYTVHDTFGQIIPASTSFTDGDLVNILTVIGGVAIGSAAIKRYIDEKPNRELRAYYNHPSTKK